MASVAAGDRAAFVRLYERYGAPIHGFLWRLAGDRDLAEDLTQETFLRAWRAAPRWRPTGRVSTWLFQIAKRAWWKRRESRANRAGIALDLELGMPELSPTVEAEIERYLEALDLVESVVDLAIRSRVQRIDKIQVRLDPGLSSRQGLGRIERTKVVFALTGTSLALDRLLVWTQRPPPGGRALLVDGFEMQNARGKEGEVRLEVTFLVPRVRAPEPTPEG